MLTGSELAAGGRTLHSRVLRSGTASERASVRTRHRAPPCPHSVWALREVCGKHHHPRITHQETQTLRSEGTGPGSQDAPVEPACGARRSWPVHSIVLHGPCWASPRPRTVPAQGILLSSWSLCLGCTAGPVEWPTFPAQRLSRIWPIAGVPQGKTKTSLFTCLGFSCLLQRHLLLGSCPP